MPTRAPVPCRHSGCRSLASRGSYCTEHQADADARARAAKERRSAATREAKRLYDSPRWQRMRAAHLAAHPLCVECAADGALGADVHVDHIRPHDGNPALFFDPGNLQTLCVAHHSRKTAGEAAAFGGRGRGAKSLELPKPRTVPQSRKRPG